MGILNTTPDSFSDGGIHFEAKDAIDAGLKMLDEGADLLDVGGESTRPGAEPVSIEEEIRRTLPVIETLASRGAWVSIDSQKPEVAKRALEAGATLVNDVGGLRLPAMVELVAEAQCGVCIMHMQGNPQTMQQHPEYKDVAREVRGFLLKQAAMAEQHGVKPENIWLDPGIGFGKTLQHNLVLLRDLGILCAGGYPVLVGVSRKSFLGKLLGNDSSPAPLADRYEATIASQVLAVAAGARIIRTHDVLAARRSLDTASAILQAR